MRTLTLEELLEAGCHFGHQVTRQNPKARDYVFEARDNIHIIDLAKTKEELEKAGNFVKDVAKKGGTMIVLGTKRQADTIVKQEVERADAAGADGLYFVTQRWIGGTLTNFSEVQKNFKKLEHLTNLLKNEMERSKWTKKELSLWDKERAKLEGFYGGIAKMTKAPDALFIIDTHLEDLAVREARATHLKTVGITDTNADPTLIDYPIPANDDAVGSIQLITAYIIDAWIEGRKSMHSGPVKEANEKQTKEPKEKSEESRAKNVEKKEEKNVEEKKTSKEKKTEAKKETKKSKEKKTVTKKPVVKAEKKAKN